MIVTCCTLGRAPRTKQTLSDFHEWCPVTRHPGIFCGLTGCQPTPRKWGVTERKGKDKRKRRKIRRRGVQESGYRKWVNVMGFMQWLQYAMLT